MIVNGHHDSIFLDLLGMVANPDPVDLMVTLQSLKRLPFFRRSST